MEKKIEAFCSILNDNNYVAKYKGIPDEFGQTDEFLADIEFEFNGDMPDSMRYFEINGFSSPVELEEWLRKEFDSFKITFITQTDPIKRKLAFEIHRQITTTQRYLLNLLSNVRAFGDISFEALVKHKIQYCNETLDFILREYGQLPDQEPEPESLKKGQIPPVYFFRISKEFKLNSAYMVSQLYKELRDSGYIDCSLRDFRKLFLNPNERLPDQTPPPIKWMRGRYNHLAYLIKSLNENFLVSQKNPSNYQIAVKLFYNSDEGKFFSPNKVRFDGRLGVEPKKTIDSIINRLGLDRRKQTFSAN